MYMDMDGHTYNCTTVTVILASISLVSLHGQSQFRLTTLNIGARLFLPFTVLEWHNCDPVDATVTRQSAVFIENDNRLRSHAQPLWWRYI
jgi:hypothetical protein